MPSALQPLIVAVDDEPDDLFFIRHVIEKTAVPHRFQAFGNGEAAVTGLTSLLDPRNGPDLPMVCFLDIKMAGMNGFDLLRWIRSQPGFHTMPTIMLSSSDDPGDVDKARDLGAQGYLRKYPSVAAMRTILEEAREFSTLPATKKTFVQWNYRFVDSSDSLAAK
jgi:CheY-like chemotaxis protein